MFWYNDDIKRLESESQHLTFVPKVAFYGSSSFTLWDTLGEDFKEYLPVNLGFGGSTLAACTWFFDTVFKPYKPERILIYAGDNDLGDRRHPEEVFIFFQQLIFKIQQKYGNIPIAFISIKTSISRFNIVDLIRYTNKIISDDINNRKDNIFYIDTTPQMTLPNGYPIKEYFTEDGLHLSKQGYTVWKGIILNEFLSKT